MNDVVMAVPLDKCSYFPKTKKLFVPLSALKATTGASRYPKSFFVRSHFTNRLLEFKTVGPGDPLFDQDQWDGEIMVYRPSNGVASKIDYAVVAHEDLA
jgi:hypothetical protein